MTDAEHECNTEDGKHTFDLNLEYELAEDEDGRIHPTAIMVRSHMHNVPQGVIAETMVTVAHKIMSEHMAHDSFAHIGDHEVAHHVAAVAASALLTEVLRRAPEALHAEVQVPDDISELMGD